MDVVVGQSTNIPSRSGYGRTSSLFSGHAAQDARLSQMTLRKGFLSKPPRDRVCIYPSTRVRGIPGTGDIWITTTGTSVSEYQLCIRGYVWGTHTVCVAM